MANVLADYILDNGLTKLDTETDKITLCSADPTTYTEANSTNALGNKTFSAGGAFGAPAARAPNGRKVASTAISDGSITATGSATKWAAVDTAGTRLHVNGSLSASQSVTNGNTFTLASFDVGIPGQ